MELKPCPRCLSNNVCVYLDGDSSDTFSCVGCGCGATSPNFDIEYLAIDWWNTRATDPLLKEMTEAFEEIVRCLSHGLQDCRASVTAKKMLQKYHERESTQC